MDWFNGYILSVEEFKEKLNEKFDKEHRICEKDIEFFISLLKKVGKIDLYYEKNAKKEIIYKKCENEES